MDNKQIEKAADEYVMLHFIDDSNVVLNDPFPEAQATYKRAFIAGAQYALSSQWKDPKVELPKTDADVVAIDANGLHIAAYFNGEWYSCDDEFTRNPQMWLPIPPLKGGDE